MKRWILAITLAASGTACLVAQDIQVNRQNKTIAVTAEESVTAEAEVAEITIGYRNYAVTHDAAFQDNVKVAERITKTFLDAGIPKENIETRELHLDRVEPNEKWTLEMKKERQFEAHQSWKVVVSAPRAQTVVDLAVQNGANQVEDAQWHVLDSVALQGKAGGAALAKARAVAEQMAKGLGTKLGELVYASNRAPERKSYQGWVTEGLGGGVGGGRFQGQSQLTLFPQKVKSDATVYAVFAIE
jgi:uncharacterized protein YggE